MRALERRLLRLGAAIARLRPPPRPEIDEARLTAEEWTEAARIGGVTREGGLAALSDADLDLAICLAQKLRGEGVGACLG
jgi:hypothetical protein